MAFAAARMILKDKRRKASKEDFTPRNRSKVKKNKNECINHDISTTIFQFSCCLLFDENCYKLVKRILIAPNSTFYLESKYTYTNRTFLRLLRSDYLHIIYVYIPAKWGHSLAYRSVVDILSTNAVRMNKKLNIWLASKQECRENNSINLTATVMYTK